MENKGDFAVYLQWSNIHKIGIWSKGLVGGGWVGGGGGGGGGGEGGSEC